MSDYTATYGVGNFYGGTSLGASDYGSLTSGLGVFNFMDSGGTGGFALGGYNPGSFFGDSSLGGYGGAGSFLSDTAGGYGAGSFFGDNTGAVVPTAYDQPYTPTTPVTPTTTEDPPLPAGVVFSGCAGPGYWNPTTGEVYEQVDGRWTVTGRHEPDPSSQPDL